MSAAYARVALSTTRSVAARASAIMCLPSIWRGRPGFVSSRGGPNVFLSYAKRWRLTRDVEEPADKALPVAHRGHFAAQPSIKAETAAGALERKQEHKEGEEHVRAWPLGRIVIEAERELQRIGDGEHADEAHCEPEDHRPSEYELGEKNNRSKHAHVRQHDILQEGAVKLERRVGRFLFGPVLQAIGHRQRQFPQHGLEPHAADQDPDQPDSKMSAGTLRRILPPILDGDRNADE